jgi:ABC-type nickel/cobalt efflux system permease component RcnA
VAVSYNVTIDQGATWYLNVEYDNPNGTPVNLTGYTAALQLRSLPESATAVLSLSTGSGITITGATGLVAISATATQTRAIDEGTYYYDLEITSAAGVVTRLVQGQAVVTPEVTR